jgi:hypothetical protein
MRKTAKDHWLEAVPLDLGDETACMFLPGRSVSRNGYKHITVGGRNQLAHRVIYEALIGPIPAGADVDHLCHNRDATCVGGSKCPHRACVNIEHLAPATRSENLHRGYWRNPRRTCRHGHPLAKKKNQQLCSVCKNAAERRRMARKRRGGAINA